MWFWVKRISPELFGEEQYCCWTDPWRPPELRPRQSSSRIWRGSSQWLSACVTRPVAVSWPVPRSEEHEWSGRVWRCFPLSIWTHLWILVEWMLYSLSYYFLSCLCSYVFLMSLQIFLQKEKCFHMDMELFLAQTIIEFLHNFEMLKRSLIQILISQS